MSNANVQRKMGHGALWLMLLTLVDRGLGLLSTLILARLLSPTDFGIVAMALSFVFLAQLLSAFGFDVALIHNQSATETQYHTAWTLNALLGLLIMLLSLAAAKPLANFYHQPAVFWVLCALALAPFIGGLENIGVVAFRKDLDFRKEFMFQISRRFIGSAVTLPLAFWMRDYWALVAGTVAARLAGTVTSYRAHPFRPRFSLQQAGPLLRFSKWMLLSNVLGVLRERMSDFVLGRLGGAGALGVYNITYEFSNLPTTEISAPVNRALLPGFAQLTDRAAVLSAYSNAMSMVALVAMPTAAGLFAVAHFFIPVALGTKWISGAPLMEIIALGSAVLVFHSSIAAVLIARGYPHTVTQLNAAFVAALAILMMTLVPRYGAVGAACAYSVTTVLVLPLCLYQLRRLVGMPLRAFVVAIVRPIISSALMIVVVRWVLPVYSPAMGTVAVAWLLIGITTGGVTYSAVCALLWLGVGRPPGAERIILDYVRARLSRIRQSRGRLTG